MGRKKKAPKQPKPAPARSNAPVVGIGVTLVVLAAWALLWSAPAPVFSGGEAWQRLETLVAFGPRSQGSPGAAKALPWLREQLAASADEVVDKSFDYESATDGRGKRRFTNLIGAFRKELPRRLTVISHWDTPWRADGTQPADPRPVPAANDGGSGCAVLLELAACLKRARRALPNGVDLILMDGEENGSHEQRQEYCAGSIWMAKDLPSRLGYRPSAVIAIDMIGKKNLEIHAEVVSSRKAPEWNARVFRKAGELGLDAFKPEPKWTIVDDHSPFLELGIPSILLIDYDYPQWHTPQDTLDKCSPASLAQVGRLLLELATDPRSLEGL